MTPESFAAWKARFEKEMATKKAREEEEKMKGMTPKEREEYKKVATRLTGQRFTLNYHMACMSMIMLGRQLFESGKNLDIADDNLMEEGTVSVDASQYERGPTEEEEEENAVTFSDSE